MLGRGASKDARAAAARPKASPPSRSARAVHVDFGPVRLLSVTPPVFLTGIPYDEYLGVAASFARRYGDVAAGFVVFPTWSLERRGLAKALANHLSRHLERFPRHRFRFICNTPEEVALLAEAGVPATFLNKNFMVSERIFRPVAAAGEAFDAVYNARFVPEKRHELAAAVPRVAYVTYVEQLLGARRDQERRDQFHSLGAAALARAPGHALLNATADGLPVTLSHEDLNAALGRAAVGLVLSEVEGSSYASMEYLLAGLPVVSTPSRGGRDVFFDPDHCLVCPPDAAAVRDAVAALKARNIPREVVRARTLARIRPERARFLALLDDLVAELGGDRRLAGGDWPFGDTSGVPWGRFEGHLAAFAAARRGALARELGLPAALLDGVQLEAQELRAVAAAVRQRPRCALLVFGCGRDSPFWEQVNRGGTTAFLEDDPAWAVEARARLATAAVHVVRYRTRLSDWPRLLDRPAALGLDLPAEIRTRRWDVVLVDGPAGYDDGQPGRMQSILAASTVVAPGGCVFVHDCERPAEQAFAARYLGEGRVFATVKGRALLKGYAF